MPAVERTAVRLLCKPVSSSEYVLRHAKLKKEILEMVAPEHFEIICSEFGRYQYYAHLSNFSG